MILFSVPDARYYCKRFSAMPGRAQGSLREFAQFNLMKSSALNEGALMFDEYRACFLRNTERNLFLAASNYRRAFDLLTASASSWAHVTLYYGSFYAAQGLLGLFGCWVDAGKFRVEVLASKPGSQAMAIASGKAAPWGTYSGTHQRFWDLFYQSMTPLMTQVEPQQVFALQPINSDVEWLSKNRNSINYDSRKALVLSGDYHQQFRRSRFPHSLPAPLKTQFEVLEQLLLISYRFAHEVRLRTDVLDLLDPGQGLRSRIRRLIYEAKAPRSCRIRVKGVAC